jgi:hypothetical protein
MSHCITATKREAGLIAPERRREPCQVFSCKPLHLREIAAKTHAINLVE